MRIKLPDGTYGVFPDDMPMEEVEAVLRKQFPPEESSAPAEAAPAPEEKKASVLPPAAEYLSRASEPYVKAAGNALKDAVNPLAYARSVGGLLKLAGRAATAGANPVSLGAEFGPDVVAAAEALKEQASTPEGMGSLAGSATVAAAPLPIGGLLGKASKWMRDSRASNVIRAVGETNPTKKAAIEELVKSGELELPVSRSAKSLQEKFKVKQEAAGTRLDAAKTGLDDLPEASVAEAVEDLKAQRPVERGPSVTTTEQPRTPAGLTSKTPDPVTKTTPGPEVSGDPTLLSAIDRQIDTIVKAAGESKQMKPAAIQKLKEQLQTNADRAGAYKAASDATEAAGSEAAKSAAKALREVLETSPDIPEAIRKNLTEANKEMSTVLSVTKPLEAQRRAHLGGNIVTRSISALLGRGLTGGGSSALGAAAGVEVGAQFQNVLFNTLTASGKAKVAALIEAGDMQGAIQAAFAEHIAETAARRRGAATP